MNLNVTKKELKNSFIFTKFQTHFIFNGTFYKQIEEVTISFPSAPALVNFFMWYHETKWLNKYNFNKTKFYLC